MRIVRGLWQRARQSLFFIPTVVITGFAITAAVALVADGTAGEALEDVPLLLPATVDGARSIVTTIAAATITVAAIVFSITALSTQMAANQYSPRAVRGFFEDFFQQLTIGFLVGTFAYCLLILGGLGDVVRDSSEATPSLSVTLAVLFGVISVIAIVAYIDHSLRRMQVDAVVRRISDSAVRAIRHVHQRARETPVQETKGGLPEGEPTRVTAESSGWVQAVDSRGLAGALPPGSTASVAVRLGEAVSPGDLLLTVWPALDEAGNAGRLVRKIRTGRQRSLETDPSFGIRQLVDIALRALSPGVNDPTTAVDVIHHLKLPIREIVVHDPPARIYTGPRGQRVFLAETPSRSDYVHAAFSEIRLAATHQPYVLRALIEVLADLIEELQGADLTGRLGALLQEAELTVAAARQSDMPAADVERTLRGAKRLPREEDEDQAAGEVAT